MVVLLNKLSRSCVVLDDPLVAQACQKFVRDTGVEADDVGRLSSGEFGDTFTSFRVPLWIMISICLEYLNVSSLQASCNDHRMRKGIVRQRV